MSYTLGLDHQGALDVRALNHRTQTLQPPEDFPISVTSEGRVLSRYQDDVWDLTPYATTATRMRFLPLVDGASAAVSIRNVGLQKRVAFWSLYGMGVRCSVNSVLGLFHVFRKIIALCTRNGVLASELFRYPAVYEGKARNDCPVLGKSNRIFVKDLVKCNAHLHKKPSLPTSIHVPPAQNCLSGRNVSPSAEIVSLCGFQYLRNG